MHLPVCKLKCNFVCMSSSYSGSAVSQMAGSSQDVLVASGDEESDVVVEAKSKLQCMTCQVTVRWNSDLLLCEKTEDWCGKLWGMCLSCSGLEAAEFKKDQRRLWKKRQTVVNGQLRARTLNWQNLSQRLKERLPTVSNKTLYNMTKWRIQAMGMAAALGGFGENMIVQKAYKEAAAVYFQNLARVANEIELPANLYTAMVNEDSDFLTAMTRSVAVSFACRRRQCRFYGMNDQWVNHADKYKFRCPMCALPYVPWRAQPGYYDYQKVVSMVNPARGMCFQQHGQKPLQTTGCSR